MKDMLLEVRFARGLSVEKVLLTSFTLAPADLPKYGELQLYGPGDSPIEFAMPETGYVWLDLNIVGGIKVPVHIRDYYRPLAMMRNQIFTLHDLKFSMTLAPEEAI
jgi:hypothetical protein